MAPVTILQVVPRLDTGGSELATLEIAEALTRAGAKALVVSEGGRMARAIAQGGGEVIEMQVASKNPLTICDAEPAAASTQFVMSQPWRR